VPNANTLIVHRARYVRAGQLYQLRGRVGRSKTRAYAYYTTPPGRAHGRRGKRSRCCILWIRWGQGFLARQPRLDIRGAGNLLGEEQSGHIREVGFELYQSMLEEAVASLKGGDLGGRRISGARRSRSHVGADSRDLCGRPAAQAGPLPQAVGLEKRADIDEFAAELVDRFGELPEEVRHCSM